MTCASDLMPEHEPDRGRRPPANHVLVAAANVGGYDLQDHAVIALPIAERQFREIDRMDLDLPRPHVL